MWKGGGIRLWLEGGEAAFFTNLRLSSTTALRVPLNKLTPRLPLEPASQLMYAYKTTPKSLSFSYNVPYPTVVRVAMHHHIDRATL